MHSPRGAIRKVVNESPLNFFRRSLRWRDFEGPAEFMQSLRDADILTRPSSLLYVQALKFLQTKATPASAQRASRARRVRRAKRASARQRRGGARKD